MTPQLTAGDKLRFRCRLQEIKLEPDKSLYDVAIKLQVDGATVHVLPPIRKGRLLHWTSLFLPCDVHEDSAITLQVTEIHTIMDRVDLAVYQMPQMAGQNASSMKCNNGMFITHLVLLGREAIDRAYLEALARARQMTERLGMGPGTVGGGFKQFLALGSMMAELDPTGSAKAVFSLCTKAWEYLEMHKKQYPNLNELVGNIAAMTPSVESVKDIVDADLVQTVATMLTLIEDISLFILNSRPLGSLGQAFRDVLGEREQNQMEDLVNRFRRLGEEFDTKVAIHALQVLQTKRIKAKLLEVLQPIGQASYDLSRGCIAGTRVQIIDELVSWAQESADGPRFAWLHGPAGLGKSSIATSVCIRLDGQRVLASSCFCKRDNHELRDPRRVLTTIIYGLASRWETYRDAVVAVAHDDPGLPSLPIKRLYDTLVTKPIQSIAQAERPIGTLVAVVDALDECGDISTRGQLLDCLRDMSQLVPLLRIIVTSRPDAEIQGFFGDSHSDWFTVYNLLDYNPLDDIRIFVRDCLGELTHIDRWPKDAVERITFQSNGLFIWARTACEFILGGFDKPRRLEQVLAGTQLASIDALYTTVIKASLPDDGDDNVQDMLKYLGVIIVTASRAPLAATNLAALLQGHISLNVLKRVLASLSSVLYVDQQLDNAIRIYHPSFMDYITTQSRSGDLCVDLEHQNTILAESCFRVMASNLKFNICGLETSNLLNRDILDLDTRVQDTIHPHLSYSCLYWSSHITQARLETLESPLRSFLFGPELIHWLETLSLLGKFSVAPACLLKFMAYCSSESMQDCSVLVNDTYRFVLSFYDAISRSTLHLYISALVFAPENSGISQRMRRFFPNLLTTTKGVEKEWTQCLRSIWASSSVNSVAFSPNSRRIASGHDDGTVWIWDAETGDMVLEPLKAHTGAVTSVTFSPDGRWVASGSYDEMVRVWDAETGETRLDPLRGHSHWVWCVAFSLDGRRIVSGSADETVRVWDAETGKLVLEPLKGHTGSVQSVAFSPNGRWIVSGSEDWTLRIWNAWSGSSAREPLRGHSLYVMSVAFSPDSSCIASCSADRTIRIWDAETGDSLLQPFHAHSHWVRSIAFSPNSQRLVSGSSDGTVRIWDTRTGGLLDTLDGHTDHALSVAFSPDGRRAVSGSADNTMRIWDVLDGCKTIIEDPSTLPGHSGSVHSVAFSSNSRYIVSGSHDRTVRIWDAETGEAMHGPLEGHLGRVLSVAFSPDDSLVVSGSTDNTVRIWDAKKGNAALGPLRGHSDWVQSVVFSPDGQLVASGSRDGTIRIWGAGTGIETLQPLAARPDVMSIAFSTDGRHIISSSHGGTMRIWDAKTGQAVLKPLAGKSSRVMSATFSLDNQRIISSSGGGMVDAWDAGTGGKVAEPLSLRGHSGEVWSVAFSRDVRWVASGFYDGAVCIWDANTGAAVLEPLRGHSGPVPSVAFSRDARRVVSGSIDMTVRVWDVEFCASPSLLFSPEHLFGTRIQTLPAQTAGGRLLVTSAQLARHLTPDLPGWVITPGGELFIWLPPELRGVDDSLFCIFPSRVRRRVTVDFTNFVRGGTWAPIADV